MRFVRYFVVLACLSPLLSAAAATRYRISLQLYPGDDPAAIAKRLAAAYRGQLEAPVDETGTFLISLSSAAAGLLARDPQVAAVNAAGVVSDTTTTWTSGTYEYDHAGNIRKIGANTYVYDAESRLSYEKAGTTRQQASYDGFGNIVSITEAGQLWTLGANTRTNRADVPSSSPNFLYGAYDGAGNMVTSVVRGSAGSMRTYSYAYDALNVMTKSVTDASRAYIYTASDERIGTIVLTAPGGGEVSSEWTVRDPAGQVLRRFWREGGQWRWMQDYVYRDGKMLASESNDQIKTLHYHLDHLGTPRLITGNGGVEVARHTYYPFGGEVPGALPQVDELKKFTGHERDGGGLDYMHARYYEYGMARFLSIDPTWESADLGNPQSWNRYSYALNNPVRYTDPDGRVALADDAVYILVGAAAVSAYLSAPSATHPGKSNAQAMAQSAVDAVKAVGTAIASVAERVKDDSPERVIVGENMERVNEGAAKTGAIPLTIENGRDPVPQSETGLRAALASGARVFDIGLDPDRATRSDSYAAESRILLQESGRVRVQQSEITIIGVPTVVWEWVQTPKR